MSTTTADSNAISECNRVLYNTYRLLGLTLANSALFAGINMAMGSIQVPIILFFLASYGLMYMVYRNRDKLAGIGYTFAFTGFMGFTLGPILNAALSVDGGSLLIMNASVVRPWRSFWPLPMDSKRDVICRACKPLSASAALF